MKRLLTVFTMSTLMLCSLSGIAGCTKPSAETLPTMEESEVATAQVGTTEGIDLPTETSQQDKESVPEKTLLPLEGDTSIQWESLNGPPGGGHIRELIQNPYKTNELYSLTQRGLHKSEDKGKSWRLMDNLMGLHVESIAASEEGLFICGNGLYYLDDNEEPVMVDNDWWNKVTISGGNIFVTRGGDRIDSITIKRAELGTGEFEWEDISPEVSELSNLVRQPSGTGLQQYVEIGDIIATEDSILVSIIVNVEGSGELTNGCLYASHDGGRTWRSITLDVPGNVIPSIIAQDPDNLRHIIAGFRHPILHEFQYPINRMVRESYDGGQSWRKLTEISHMTNGIAGITVADQSYYLLNPWDGYILKLDGDNGQMIDVPRVEEFENMTFGLAKLIFDPDNPNTVYGMTDPVWALGLVKSEDNMRTWHKMDKDIIASSPTIVMAHPTDPDTIYTTSNVIQESYMTRDGGKTWEPFSPNNSDDEIRIDPHDPEHILLITEMSTIYESFDSGKTWRTVDTGFSSAKIHTGFSSAKILDFEITDDVVGDIYVSNTGVGISKYSGDADWQYMINSPDYVYDIELDPDDNNIVYAGYSPKIFENHSSIWRYSPHQAEDFGWSEILRLEDSKGVTSIAFDELNTDYIYAGVIGDRGAIYVSKDRGNSWRLLNEDFVMCTIWGQPQLIVHPNEPSTAYAATWLGGTWKTTDAGQTWTLLENAPISGTALSLNKDNPEIIYLADRSSPTVWKSEDGGETWREVANFRADGALLTMRVLADGDTVFASTFNPALVGGKLYKSEDTGSTWADITGTLPKGILDMATDPTNPDIVYITTNINGVYKSTDGGASWTRLDSHPYVGVYDIEVDPVEPNTLYTAARGGSLPSWFTEISGDFPDGIVFEDDAGVYKSTDGGVTWDKVLVTSASCRVIRMHPDNHNVLFAVDLIDGMKMSVNGGDSWEYISSELGTQVLTSCAVGSDKIYVGTQGCGVNAGDYDIKTNSVTWQPSRSNKPVPEVYNLQIQVDPTNSNNLFVTSYPGGMYASADGGITFRDRNAITPSIVVDYPLQEGYYALAVNPNDSRNMWLGTWGKGIYKSYNSMLLNVPAGLFGKHIRQVIIDPMDSNTIYAATKEGIFVTRDEGATWEEMNNGLGTLDITRLKILSTDRPPYSDDFEDGDAAFWQLEDGWSVIQDGDNHVLQGMGHKWANTGQISWLDYTFEAKIKPVTYGGGIHVVFRKNNDGRYFLSFHQGGLNLSKQFNKWTEFKHNIAHSSGSYNANRWYDLRIEVKGADIKVYVNDLLQISYTDTAPLLTGSIAFETLDNAHFYVDDVRVTTHGIDQELYAGTAGYGIYRYNFSSGEWYNLGRTLGTGWWSPWERRMYQFSSLLFDPDIPEKVYLGHFPSGFFISEDNGRNWTDSSLGLGNDGMFSLAMHPHEHNVLFAGTYNGVVKSTDGGTTWEMKSEGMPAEQWPYTVAIDDDNPDIMYVSTKNGQNKGFCHRNDFCGVVMKSTDGGESWFKIMDGLNERSEFYTLLIYPLNHDILFLSTNRGFYISRDAGDSWQEANSGLPTTNNQVRDNVAQNLVITPDNKSLLLGVVGYGVWKADLSKLNNG